MILEEFPNIYSDLNMIISILFAVVIPILFLTILNNFISRVEKNNSISSKSIALLTKILRYLTFVIILLLVMGILGIDLHSLFVSVGIVSLAVTLAAKDTLSNVISGIILVLEKRFVIGDMIEIDGYKGQVQKIGFKSVELLYKKRYMVVPNVLFTTKPFINHTRNGYYAVYFDVKILNKYNLDEKIEQLDKILSESDLILKNPEHLIMIKNITTTGVDVKVKVYIEDPTKDSRVVSSIITTIKREMILEDME